MKGKTMLRVSTIALMMGILLLGIKWSRADNDRSINGRQLRRELGIGFQYEDGTLVASKKIGPTVIEIYEVDSEIASSRAIVTSHAKFAAPLSTGLTPELHGVQLFSNDGNGKPYFLGNRFPDEGELMNRLVFEVRAMHRFLNESGCHFSGLEKLVCTRNRRKAICEIVVWSGARLEMSDEAAFDRMQLPE